MPSYAVEYQGEDGDDFVIINAGSVHEVRVILGNYEIDSIRERTIYHVLAE